MKLKKRKATQSVVATPVHSSGYDKRDKRTWHKRVIQLGLTASLMFGCQFALGDKPESLRYTSTVLAIKNAEPAVVNIEGNKPSSTAGNEGQQVNGMGAGVIIDSRGYILTNQHVVQDVSKIEVTLSNGRKFVAQLIDRDPETDLALVKISSDSPLPVVRCGTSSDLMRGEPVIAIGNPFGYHHTVTEGIISALHRDIPVNGVQEYPDLIQTDASINPGNSGGPLLNAEGVMIGINAAVRVGAQGIGFAIPVDRATEVAAKMIAKHRNHAIESPFDVETVSTEDGTMVRVSRVGDNSEIRRGAVITAVAGKSIRNRLDYELALVDLKPNSQVEVTFDVGGDSKVTQVEIVGSSGPRSQLVSTSNSAPNSAAKVTARTAADAAYRVFGIRLGTVDPREVRTIDSNYKGGLRVLAVRANSPADIAQIKTGDVLVGLIDWQTPDWEDLAYILNSSELVSSKSPTFHVIRNRKVYWGNLELK